MLQTVTPVLPVSGILMMGVGFWPLRNSTLVTAAWIFSIVWCYLLRGSSVWISLYLGSKFPSLLIIAVGPVLSLHIHIQSTNQTPHVPIDFSLDVASLHSDSSCLQALLLAPNYLQQLKDLLGFSIKRQDVYHKRTEANDVYFFQQKV